MTKAAAFERASVQLSIIHESIDTNKDGMVSKQELVTALDNNQRLDTLFAKAGFNTKDNLLAQLDTDKDGGVSKEEFKEGTKKMAAQEVEMTGNIAAAELPVRVKALKQLKAIFDSLDANKDGAVCKKEFAAKLIADELSEDDSFRQMVGEAGLNPALNIFEKLDVNHDGLITWDEFDASLRKVATEEVQARGDLVAVCQLDNSTASPCGCSLWGCAR